MCTLISLSISASLLLYTPTHIYVYTHTTHTHIYIHIYVYMSVCVRMCEAVFLSSFIFLSLKSRVNWVIVIFILRVLWTVLKSYIWKYLNVKNLNEHSNMRIQPPNNIQRNDGIKIVSLVLKGIILSLKNFYTQFWRNIHYYYYIPLHRHFYLATVCPPSCAYSHSYSTVQDILNI